MNKQYLTSNNNNQKDLQFFKWNLNLNYFKILYYVIKKIRKCTKS